MISKLFMSLCLLIGLSAVMTTNAQIASGTTLEANIPHSFIVKDTTLPAGKYTIRVVEDAADLNLLEIRSVDRRTAVFFETESVHLNDRARDTELVFDKLGDNYFLSRVFLSGDESGGQLPKSKMQRKLEDGGMTAETHSIAASKKAAKQSGQSAKKGS